MATDQRMSVEQLYGLLVKLRETDPEEAERIEQEIKAAAVRAREIEIRRLGDLGAQIAETDPDALRDLVEEAEALAAAARVAE